MNKWSELITEVNSLRTELNSLKTDVYRSRRMLRGYTDLSFPMTTGKLPGVNIPTWAAFQGNTYEYTFAVNDYIHLPSKEIPHGYKPNTEFEFHTHIVTNGLDATARDVNYEIEYTIGDTDEAMSAAATVTSGDYTIPANTADRTHLYVTLGTITSTYTTGAAIKLRFRRIALTGGGAAPSNDPFVLMAAVHLYCDTFGSRTRSAK